jgi:hypothetical protein
MSSALDAFRALREAVEQVRVRLGEIAELVRNIHAQIDAVTQDRAFRELVQDERDLLERAERMISEVRRLREQELARFWPGVWRRWIAAVVFSLAASASFGAGYVWAVRPLEAELTSLRSRVELLDFVAQRVLTMTPAERRQFDTLIKSP